MLTFLAILLSVVALTAVAVVAIAARRPDGFRVQRSILINAPAEKIYPLIADFRAWDAWSPWEHKDPNMKRSYSGAASGKGSIYAWDGNKEVGVGEMVMAEASAPSKVVLDMHFKAPFDTRNTAEFILVPEGSGTKVTWVMHGPTPLMAKIFHLFMDFDKLVGVEFEKGLAAMKAKSEGTAP